MRLQHMQHESNSITSVDGVVDISIKVIAIPFSAIMPQPGTQQACLSNSQNVRKQSQPIQGKKLGNRE